MPPSRPMAYQDKDPSPTPWVALFVLLSILAHILVIGGLVVISFFLPAPHLTPLQESKPSVTLSLMPPPQAQKAPKPPPMPQLVLPPLLQQQQDAPHKDAPLANIDAQMSSLSKVARDPTTIVPDIQNNVKHAGIQESTTTPAPNKKANESTPPVPDKPSPQPPQPKPAPPKPTPEKPEPPKPPPPQVAKNQVDPNTGLPVLPPIDAPPMAPQSQNASKASKPSERPMQAQDTSGRTGLYGAPSPEAMATIMGKYQALVYNAVGSRWHPKALAQMQVLPAGSVHIQYTIYADGTVSTKVLDGGNGTMQLLVAISVNSIRESAPFRSFDEFPGLRQELMKYQGGDGSSFTGDFVFELYSP